MKKIIGFDMDGVIVDHAPTKVMLADKMGFKIKPEETPSEVIKKLLPFDVYRALQHQLYDYPDTAYASSLMPGARELLTELVDAGKPFFLISRRRNPEVAVELLRQRGLWPKFFNENNAFFVLEKEDKNAKAQKLGITHYVDDETGVLEKLEFVKNKFLFDKFNVFAVADNYQKVGSWEDLRGQLL